MKETIHPTVEIDQALDTLAEVCDHHALDLGWSCEENGLEEEQRDLLDAVKMVLKASGRPFGKKNRRDTP